MLQALKLREDLKDHWGIAGSLVNIASVQAGLGEFQSARTSLPKAVTGFQAVSDTKLGFCECLEAGAELAQAERRSDDAVTLFVSANNRRKASGSERSPLLIRLIDGHLALLKTKLGSARFEKACSQANQGDSFLKDWAQGKF